MLTLTRTPVWKWGETCVQRSLLSPGKTPPILTESGNNWKQVYRQMERMSVDGWMQSARQLWRAEAGIGLCAASALLGGDAGSHGAGDGVAGAGGALQRFLRDDLPQGVLLLDLEDVWLLSLVLADTEGERGRAWLGFSFTQRWEN